MFNSIRRINKQKVKQTFTNTEARYYPLAKEFINSFEYKLNVILSYNNITDKNHFCNVLSRYLCMNWKQIFTVWTI